MKDRLINELLPDEKMHEGHRSRMRAKLLSHGQRIFDTYELLEMLLYYTVPYRDTNPIAKRLLGEFGDLDGVFRAPTDELIKVSGVGEKTARLINTVGELTDILGSEPELTDGRFTDHCRLGQFLVSCFKSEERKKILALFFDNSMSLLSMDEVYTDIDYDSGIVTAKPFLDRAMKLGAVAVITAHNHPYSSPYPTAGDRATNKTLKTELEKARVTLAEHYIISGDRYTAIVDGFVTNYSQSVFLDNFIKSRRENEGYEDFFEPETEEIYYNTEDLDYFSTLVSFATKKNPEEMALKLMKKFFTIEKALTANPDRLEEISGASLALFLKLVAYLTSRRRTDRFEFNKNHTLVEIAEYFKAIFIGVWVESVYLMCFDFKGRAVHCERVSEGIVNSAEVLPRKLLEIAVKNSSTEVLLAHNHPFGKTLPSRDDIELTENIRSLFRSAGIKLSRHMIVSGQRCEVVSYEDANV